MKKIVVCIFMSLAFLFLCGCETTKTQYIETEKLPTINEQEFQKGVVKIAGIFLKKGTYIDLIDKNAEVNIEKGIKYISYEESLTKQNRIVFEDIGIVKVNTVEGNLVTPILAIIIFSATLITILIGSNIHYW